MHLVSECGRTHQGLAALEKGRRLFLADLSKTCLTGICCYFDRTDVNDPVTPEKIHEVKFDVVFLGDFICFIYLFFVCMCKVILVFKVHSCKVGR